MATEANPNITFTEEIVENEGHGLTGDNKDEMNQLPNASHENLEQEGESSSTLAANLVTTHVVQPNELDIDQTGARSRNLLLPSQEMIEAFGGISTPHISQQSRVSVSNTTMLDVYPAQFYTSSGVAQQQVAFNNPNIEQDLMHLCPPTQSVDAPSQVLFTSQGTYMNEDDAYNISQQPNNTDENSYWPLNSYQFQVSNMNSEFSLAPTPDIQLSNSHQASIGVGSGQYSPSFLQTQLTADLYSQNRINMQEPLSNPSGSQEIQFQGLTNQGQPSNFFSSDGGLLSSMQLQPTRMNMQDGIASSSNLQPSNNWISQGLNFNNLSTTPNLRSLPLNRNGVYDPAYEAMGLPVDPHLRMFLARRDASNGDDM